ncbi:SHOCT domain-containing protein [Rhizobium sp. R86522]|uniref:SHOCT domain-containing protein n=1 Tax=Rhizobium sp. R86522 TaxID=3093861 RepID=UPI003672574E
MGSFSIWHWIVVFLILFLPLYLLFRKPRRKASQDSAAQSGGLSNVEKLEKLAKLKADGAITAAEYDAEKRRIIG